MPRVQSNGVDKVLRKLYEEKLVIIDEGKPYFAFRTESENGLLLTRVPVESLCGMSPTTVKRVTLSLDEGLSDWHKYRLQSNKLLSSGRLSGEAYDKLFGEGEAEKYLQNEAERKLAKLNSATTESEPPLSPELQAEKKLNEVAEELLSTIPETVPDNASQSKQKGKK